MESPSGVTRKSLLSLCRGMGLSWHCFYHQFQKFLGRTFSALRSGSISTEKPTVVRAPCVSRRDDA